MKYVTYLRVSTDKQGERGLGMDAQRSAVTAFAKGEIIGEFVEVKSGAKNNRPQLAEAIKMCKEQKATLLIAKLDRLARNVHFISGLMESGVEFVAADMPTANRLTIHILAAVAEHEREMISQRTKAALQAAKARGVDLRKGGKARGAIQVSQAIERAKNVIPVINELRECGITSLMGIADVLNDREIKTPKGGTWFPIQVSRVLKRVAV